MTVRRYKGLDVRPIHPDTVYACAYSNALTRGIAWEFCIATWWDVWRDHWPNRQRDSLIMCRFFDVGAYAPYNVYIGTPTDNAADRVAARRLTKFVMCDVKC